MSISPEEQRKFFVYFYDLHRDILGTEIAKTIFNETGVLIHKFPIIHYKRDMHKPFYSAAVSLENVKFNLNPGLDIDKRVKNIDELKKALKYIKIGGHEVRALPYDGSIFGKERQETNQRQNIYLKVDKNSNVTHRDIEQKIENDVEGSKVKSLKLSRNENYKLNGYGFVCFEDQEQAKAALKKLGSDAKAWNPRPI